MNITCPRCGQTYELGQEFIGKKVHCQVCNNDFTVENPNLIPCPDCFQPISRRAVTCPHCGAPLSGSSAMRQSGQSHDGKDEKEVLVCHPAAIYYLLDIIVGILLAPIIIGLFILGSAIINIYCTTYILTSKRIIVKTGWLNKNQNEIWIKDMRAVNLNQSFWERLVGTGSVAIGTAATAGTEIQIRGVSHAKEVVDTINGIRNS